MSSVPASTQSPLPIRERILDAVCAALDAIDGITHVYRHREAASDYDYPALRVLDRGDVATRRVQHVYDARIALQIVVYQQDHEREERRQDLARYRAAVIAAAMVDETWGGLAWETLWQTGDEQQSEAGDPDGLNLLQFEIAYRTELDDPYVTVEL